MKKIWFTCAALLVVFTNSYSQSIEYCINPTAFLKPSHPTSIDTQTVFVKKVTDYYGNNFWIKLNIHSPKSDNLPFSKRPLLIGIHGGAWVSDYTGFGPYATDAYNQLSAILDAYGTSYGFITASLDYRTGFGGGNEIAIASEVANPGSVCNNPLANWQMMMGELYNACYRATQDTRSAISYVFDHAAELGIDTENVFIFGASAGAITALHATFSDEKNFFSNGAGDLGRLEPLRKIKGCISTMGAMFHRGIESIDSSKRTATQFFHGLSDPIVPYKDGPVFSCNNIPKEFEMHGDSILAEQLCTTHSANELVLLENMGHDLTPDSVMIGTKMRSFMRSQFCPTSNTDSNFHYIFTSNGKLHFVSDCRHTRVDTTSSTVEQKFPNDFVGIFPNPASASLTLSFIETPSSEVEVTISDILGNELQRFSPTGQRMKIDLHTYSDGIYIVRVRDVNSVLSQKIELRR